MATTPLKRIGIGMNADDLKCLKALQKKHGAIGPTAIVRMALRNLIEAGK